VKEVKILEQRARQMQEVDLQDMQTLAELEEQTKVPYYLERDEERDEPIVNPDGTISYVRCVNVNGVQWQIPVEKRCEIPKTIYELIEESEYIKRRYRPKEKNFIRVDLGYDHLFI